MRPAKPFTFIALLLGLSLSVTGLQAATATNLPTDSILFLIKKNYFNRGEYAAELSRHYYRLALDHAAENTPERHRIQVNYSRLLFLEEKYDSAIDELQQLIPDIRQNGNNGLLPICHLNLGSYYSALEQRYRLRKKLGLDKDTALEKIIAGS
ncbi:MAG: hypothetical protein K2O01_03705 [Bacteroidales bacterium]|nr:hypothetical protein [Bacteroidales bacterium]